MSAVLAEYAAAFRSTLHALRHPQHQAFALALLVVLTVGVVFYSLAEDWSLVDSLYFTIVALSTIGFGDLAPTTTASRLFTVFYAMVGVGLISALLKLIVTRPAEAIREQKP